jgi:hypothetical protein
MIIGLFVELETTGGSMGNGPEQSEELAELCELADQLQYYRVLRANSSMSQKDIDRKIDRLIRRYPPEDYPGEWQHLNPVVATLTNPEMRNKYHIHLDLCRRVEKGLLKKLPDGLIDRIRNITWEECESELSDTNEATELNYRVEPIVERILSRIPEILPHHEVFREDLPANYQCEQSNPKCQACHGTGSVECTTCHGRGCYACNKKGMIKCECRSTLLLSIPKTIQNGGLVEARVLVQPGAGSPAGARGQYFLISVRAKPIYRRLYDPLVKPLKLFLYRLRRSRILAIRK